MSATHQSQALILDIPIIVVTDQDQNLPETLNELINTTYDLKLANLEHPDIHWLNPTDSLKIEVVRQLQEMSSYKPYQSHHSIFIASHLEAASLPAQQALLKILEEPPAHVRLLLCTSQLENLLPTLLSRCQVWRPLPTGEDRTNDQVESQKWYQQMTEASYGQIVTFTDQTSDRSQVQKLTIALITALHFNLELGTATEQRPQLVKQLFILRELLERLRANVNVKLAVEEAFFKIKKVL